MPKGQKIVDWTNPQNDAKLLVAVLKHCDVSKVHDKIAKDFGRSSKVDVFPDRRRASLPFNLIRSDS